QLDPGRPSVDENPLPSLTDEEPDGFGGGVHLEQLWVLHFAAARPPAGEALLGIKIEQRDASALFCCAYGKRAGKCGLADAALGTGERDDAQSCRLLGAMWYLGTRRGTDVLDARLESAARYQIAGGTS